MQLLPAVMDAHRRATVKWLCQSGIEVGSWQDVYKITGQDLPADAYVPTSVSVDYPDFSPVRKFQTPLCDMTDFVLSASGCVVEEKPVSLVSKKPFRRLGALIATIDTKAVFLDLLGKQHNEIAQLIVVNATADSPPVACHESNLEIIRQLYPEAKLSETRAFEIASNVTIDDMPIVAPLNDEQCALLTQAVRDSTPEYLDDLLVQK